ncbi:MAG: serine hydrolase [Bryobacteraceae bacterium]
MLRPICALLLFAACAPAQRTAAGLLEVKTLAELERYDAGFDGVLGVAVIDLESGRVMSLNGDTVFPQASVIKIPILAALYRGGLRLDDPVTVEPSEAVGGSGRLQHRLKSGPVTMTLRELATLMIVDSDNTATNKCISLAGMDEINRMLAESGFLHTRLQRKMMDARAAAEGRENLSTPNEMARLVEHVYRARIVDAAASREMLAIMRRVSGGIREGLPLDTDVACKTGQIPGARGETGIVFLPGRPFVLSVMSAFIDDRRTPVPEVTRTVYRMFEKLSASNPYGHRIR